MFLELVFMPIFVLLHRIVSIKGNPAQTAGATFAHLTGGAEAAGHADAAAVAPAAGVVDVADAAFVKDVDGGAVVVGLVFGVGVGDGLVGICVVGEGHAGGGGDQGPEEEVLHDGQFAQDLGDEHAAHAALDLAPGPGGGDVVEHGAVPAQAVLGGGGSGSSSFTARYCRRPRNAVAGGDLDAVDEADLAEVEVVVAKLLEGQGLVDGARGDEAVVEQLGGAEQKGQELVVVEAPDAVGAGRLEGVGADEFADDKEVSTS